MPVSIYSLIKGCELSGGTDDERSIGSTDDEMPTDDLVEYIYVDSIEELKLKRVENPIFFYYLIITEEGAIRVQSSYRKFDDHGLFDDNGEISIYSFIGVMEIVGFDVDSYIDNHMFYDKDLTDDHTECQLKDSLETYKPNISQVPVDPAVNYFCLVYTYGALLKSKDKNLEYRIIENEKDMKIDLIDNFDSRKYGEDYLFIDEDENVFVKDIHEPFINKYRLKEEEIEEEIKRVLYNI